MINKIRCLYKGLYMKRLVKRGLKLGNNVDFEKGVNIDANFPWLIEIGDNVILSPWVYILSHDAACKHVTGMTRIGKVKIEKDVYIGAKTTILPGCVIGEGSIIGANSLVNKDVPAYSVAAGNPVKVICTLEEYKEKYIPQLNTYPQYDRSYTIWGGIDNTYKNEMVEQMKDRFAFIYTEE